MLIDAHAHVDRYELAGKGALDAALAEIEQRHILTISNSMDPASYERNLDIAARCSWVLPVFGVHPWSAPEWVQRLDELRAPAEASPMLGEVGLDHYFVEEAEAYPAQREVLEFFLAVARDRGKIVHLHTKGAEQVVLDLLDRWHIRRAVVHWYSGPLDILREYIARGCYFTVGLEVRYSDHVRDIAREIPADRLLTETDNPGGPHGYLGRPGSPGLIEQVVEALAAARGIPPQTLVRSVQDNLSVLLAGDPWLNECYRALLQPRGRAGGGDDGRAA